MSMIFANFTPWQLLLWVAAFLMIVTPLIVILVTACVNGYFSAKEKHMKAVAKYFGDCLLAASKAAEEVVKKKAEELKARGENK